MSIPFRPNDKILFIGDSVTDCDRDRSNPDSMGEGFASMVAGRLIQEHAELNLHFLNRGISGDRTCDLLNRWSQDCIDLQTNWVSLLVGVNNTWRRYDSNDPTPDDIFEEEYNTLCERLKQQTNAKIVICSPFLVHTDPSVVAMREDLNPKIEIIKKLANRFADLWIDFDAAFIASQQRHLPSYWAQDGVHPSVAGHALMAETWITGVIS